VIPDRCSDPSRLFVGIDVSWWTRTADAIVRKPTADPALACPRMRPILCGWLARLVGGVRPAYVAAFVDSKAKTWRDLETRHLPPEKRYKAGRTVCPPEYWTEYDGFLEILRLHGIPCFRAEGWEADDVAATVTRYALAAGLDVALVTLDHDWRALCRDRDDAGGEVYCWSYGRTDAKTIGPAEMMADENLGVPPSLVADFIALTGDGDNIAGVRGLGPPKVRAALNRWGSVPGILAASPSDVGEIEAQIKSAEKQRDRLKR
jgi:5'-3' exonuclease